MKITTERLVIRSLAVKDRLAMKEILTDFENSDVYMYDYEAPTDMETILALIPRWVKSRRYYTISLKDGGDVIGFLLMDGNELGFTMKSAYKRKGYGYEAASALLEYVCYKKGIDHFIAQAAADNVASVGLLKKLGFRPESLIAVRFRENLPCVECINFELDI